MRPVVVLSLALSAGLLPRVASAQEVAEGERVVTVRDAALRANNDTTGTVPKGNVLDVKHVNGDWYWVVWTQHKTMKGWVNRSDVILFSQALDFFDDEVKRNPSAWAYNARGLVWFGKGDLDRAIADFTAAIRLDPKFSAAYDNRGLAWGREKEYQKAIADYNEAIRLDPTQVNPWNDRAWEEATSIENHVRDGKKAVKDATKALELAGSKDDPMISTTLAAAYAEAGDFQNAVKWQERAVHLAPTASQKTDWQSRLDLYKGHEPFREE
jgi:tetratricopeptide (TPR) repeat protein